MRKDEMKNVINGKVELSENDGMRGNKRLHRNDSGGRRAVQNGESIEMLKIRPFAGTDADYESAVFIENTDFPDTPKTANELKFFDSVHEPNHYFARFLGEVNGEIMALGVVGHLSYTFRPDKYFVSVHILPAYRNQGLEDRFYDFLVDHLDGRNVDTLVGMAREDQTYILDLLARKGFQVDMRYPAAKLDVDHFDFARFVPELERVRQSGIWIGNLKELADLEPDWQSKLYDLDWILDQDVPTPEPVTRRPFDIWLRWITDSPFYLAEGFIVARDGHELVGVSSLWKIEATRESLHTGLTGVLRSHRRRGIATALKTAAIQFAREYGAREIESENEENNPMFDLNLRLGFKPAPAMLDLHKKVLEVDKLEDVRDGAFV